MGRRDFEEDWKEVLGWGDGDIEPASVMLRLTHPDGAYSLIVKEVFLEESPEEGDYLNDICLAKIVGVHEVFDGLIVSAEAHYGGSDPELVKQAVGLGWEFLSIDHEMN